MKIAFILSSMLILIGCFMPWIMVGPQVVRNGIDNPDAIIILVAGILSFIVAIMTKKKFSVIHFILGAACLAVGILDYMDINSRNQLISAGTGLYLILAGSAVLVVTSFIAFFSRKKPLNNQ